MEGKYHRGLSLGERGIGLLPLRSLDVWVDWEQLDIVLGFSETVGIDIALAKIGVSYSLRPFFSTCFRIEIYLGSLSAVDCFYLDLKKTW